MGARAPGSSGCSVRASSGGHRPALVPLPLSCGGGLAAVDAGQDDEVGHREREAGPGSQEDGLDVPLCQERDISRLVALEAKRIAQADQPRPSIGTSLSRNKAKGTFATARKQAGGRGGRSAAARGPYRATEMLPTQRPFTSASVRACPDNRRAPRSDNSRGAQRFLWWRNVLDGSASVELISRHISFRDRQTRLIAIPTTAVANQAYPGCTEEPQWRPTRLVQASRSASLTKGVSKGVRTAMS